MFRGDFTSNTKLRLNNFQIGRLPDDFMVSTGAGGAAEEDMDRLMMKPLHNFDLPWLKWGNQKLLRCMKVDSTGDVSVADRNHSSETGGGGTGGGGGGGYVIGAQRQRQRKRFRSSGGDRETESCYKFSSSEKVKARIGITGDGENNEIEATREKLMFDFQKEVGRMKEAILGERLVDRPAPAPAEAEAAANPPAERPWNLRTRRAACKAPRSPSNAVVENGDVSRPNTNTSPVRTTTTTTECKNPTTSGEKRDRLKFSVSLSRRELEEDFMAMAGRRLPRKPKKRPRIVQRQLDTLFPGLWLSEITPDLYKVPDESDAGKR